jgi:hypothetical protein
MVAVAALAIWAVDLPKVMVPTSKEQIANSIFSASRTTGSYSVSDGSGSYVFDVGFDYPDTPIPVDAPVRFRVYVVLVSENLSSPLMRGASLRLDNSSLYIDGSYESRTSLTQQVQQDVEVYSFQLVNPDFSSGPHSVVADLVLSVIDANYFGFTVGTDFKVSLAGQIFLTW